MDLPDTIIELHRERVQADAATVFSGGTYPRPYDDPTFRLHGTATLTVALDRVWFVLDGHGRLWQEEAAGKTGDPERHFAIDLQISDSQVVIETIADLPLLPLPPVTVTIPEGPRKGQSCEIPYNVIPLFGHLTLHDQLARRVVEPGSETISLNFNPEDAPGLVAGPPPNQYVSHLFGAGVERRANGTTAFAGRDPRVTWDLDYAEAFWITHSILGEILVAKERLLHPLETDEEARRRVLDSIATEIGLRVGEVAGTLGTMKNGVVDLLPNPLEVDPASTDDGIRELDVGVQRFEAGGVTQESMTIQLRTLDSLPASEALPVSVLAENPSEQTALAATGYGLLLGARESVKRSFCLDDDAFDPSVPCRLDGSRDVEIAGEMRTLQSFGANIEEGTDVERGRLVIEGRVSGSNWVYEFDASFTITYELDLDDIPREAAKKEVGISTGETMRSLQDGLREAAEARCRGDITGDDYEKEAARVRDLLKEPPRSTGIAPTLRPSKPDVDADFSLTTAGYVLVAIGIALLVAAVSLPATAPIGIAALSWEAYLGLAVLAFVEYIAVVIDLDWVGTAMVRGKVASALGQRPGGSLLPTLGVPIDVWLRRHLTVYFRPLPPRLGVSCVKRDTRDDVDEVIQMVGGRWPTDGKAWRISVSDGARLVDSKKLELFVDSSATGGPEQPIHAVDKDGRWYLRTNPDDEAVDNLASLPECPITPEL